MKKKVIRVGNKIVKVRMNGIEFERLEKLIKRTTATSISEYARHKLLANPVTVKFKNV